MPVPRAVATTVRAVATGRAATVIYKAIFDSELYKVCGSYTQAHAGNFTTARALNISTHGSRSTTTAGHESRTGAQHRCAPGASATRSARAHPAGTAGGCDHALHREPVLRLSAPRRRAGVGAHQCRLDAAAEVRSHVRAARHDRLGRSHLSLGVRADDPEPHAGRCRPPRRSRLADQPADRARAY